MGLFDSWRRKKKSKATVRLQEPEKPKSVKDDTAEISVKAEADDLVDLVAEYERLVKRREELQVERGMLTVKLDHNEIEPDDFRKELMSKIQEAAAVSETLRIAAAKLTSRGYRGVLH